MAANTKSTWFDENSNASLIADKAQRLESFLQAMADGKVTDAEVKSQEERVVKLMKEIEPKLDGSLHDQVTQLLCEVTAYDLMQALNMMQSAADVEVSRLNVGGFTSVAEFARIQKLVRRN